MIGLVVTEREGRRLRDEGVGIAVREVQGALHRSRARRGHVMVGRHGEVEAADEKHAVDFGRDVLEGPVEADRRLVDGRDVRAPYMEDIPAGAERVQQRAYLGALAAGVAGIREAAAAGVQLQ